MTDKTTIHDEAPAHRYFTQMLNMAEDDLDPFQYRLLAHYVRWAGDGQPYPESIRVTAKAVKMSTKKVDTTIDELSSLGYIEVYRPTAEEARNGKTIRITVLDRWMENINRFQRKPVVKSTQGVVNLLQACSKFTTPPVVNLLRSEEQEEEQRTISRKRDKPPATSTEQVKELISTWWNACGYVDMGQNYATVARKAKAREMLKWDQPVTPDEVRAYIEPLVKAGQFLPDFVYLPDRLSTARGLKGKRSNGVMPELKGVKRIIR